MECDDESNRHDTGNHHYGVSDIIYGRHYLCHLARRINEQNGVDMSVTVNTSSNYDGNHDKRENAKNVFFVHKSLLELFNKYLIVLIYYNNFYIKFRILKKRRGFSRLFSEYKIVNLVSSNCFYY